MTNEKTKNATIAPAELRINVPHARPIASVRPRESRTYGTATRSWSQTVALPEIHDATRLPPAPTENASAVAGTATETRAMALPSMMRPRCGTMVNVVSPLRWLHSAVTARAAMIGRITDIGNAIVVVNVL